MAAAGKGIESITCNAIKTWCITASHPDFNKLREKATSRSSSWEYYPSTQSYREPITGQKFIFCMSIQIIIHTEASTISYRSVERPDVLMKIITNENVVVVISQEKEENLNKFDKDV